MTAILSTNIHISNVFSYSIQISALTKPIIYSTSFVAKETDVICSSDVSSTKQIGKKSLIISDGTSTIPIKHVTRCIIYFLASIEVHATIHFVL